MRVLVTGGAGFIGSHLVERLLSDGHFVRIYDNLDPQVHGHNSPNINNQAEFIKADIRDTSSLSAALSDIDIIFHEAALVGVGQSMYQLERYTETNTLGTATLLDLLIKKDHDVKKLIVASSMSIYGEGAYKCEDHGVVFPQPRTLQQIKKNGWDMQCPYCSKKIIPVPTPESKPLQPTSIYALTKKDQEEMSLITGRSYGLPVVALRYFNTYGPGQALSNPYTGVCAIFLSQILNNNPPLIFEDGHQSRDFISVHDIVQASLLAMEKSNADYKVYNVGTGQPTSIANVAAMLLNIFHRPIQLRVNEKFRSGDVRHCYADISSIGSELGFKPTVQLSKGLRDLSRWVSNQRSVIDNSQRALSELEDRRLVTHTQ
jgi:dTDP-L-rhamnose 4-epimerase